MVAADTGSVGPQGRGQSGRGLWPSLVHSRLLRGWPGARVPEGRREPFKETFLCFKKKKNRETRNIETHNKVSGLAGGQAWNAQLWAVGGGGPGGQQATKGHPGIRPANWGPQCRSKSSERTRTGPGVRFHGSPLRQGGTWRREWQPTPVFLPGECLGHKSLVGYSPGGCKESDTIERLVL